MKGLIPLLLLALASYDVDAQEPQEAQLVEVFQESDAIPSPDEASGRSFGMFQNFDALGYKENLLHNKISFLFSLVPRPNVAHWNRPPYPGGLGPYPMQPGGFPPGYPAQLPQPGPLRPPPFGGGPNPSQGFYPGAGFNNPYYPSVVPGYPAMPPGLYSPGILPVVSENNITTDVSGGGNKPSASAAPASSASAVVAAASTAAPTTTTTAASADESVAAAAEEEETKRHTIIKMMPKSFHMN
ncbi:actin nucleation-promoting factor WAS-like [Daphnia carinata]|uniref:actin nucleation-promoting factor WAS-like n=1 Tax=Daphnia carinata TaxID=120202 RepID=UPI0028687512|nr:actin nucleation-promoting factor WAS-like [Daphnia carinata]